MVKPGVTELARAIVLAMYPDSADRRVRDDDPDVAEVAALIEAVAVETDESGEQSRE